MSLATLAGLVLAIAVLVTLPLHLRLTALPPAFWALVRKERAQDGGILLEAMKEAVASRAGQAVIAVQTYQDQLAQSLRAQIADAETRARAAERRAAESTAALEAASTVLRELRAALEAASEVTRELRSLHEADRKTSEIPAPPDVPATLGDTPRASARPGDTLRAPVTLGDTPRASARPGDTPRTPASGSRQLPKVGAEDAGFDDEDEMTRVADRPNALAALLRARRAPPMLPPAPSTSSSEGAR